MMAALPFGIGPMELGLVVLLALLFFPIIIGVTAVVLLARASIRRGPGAPAVTAPPAWLDDPTGRHEYRYWDGARWTASVSDQGVQSQDPV